MQIFLVRHAESEGNRQGIMQGRSDYALSALGREQATRLGTWLEERRFRWDAVYCSPARRAQETLRIVREQVDTPEPAFLEDLWEVHCGRLQDLDRAGLQATHPGFFERGIETLGDFSEYGGESYDDVQGRVGRLRARWERDHREAEHDILVVAHGGLNFQLLKSLICQPVPKVAIVRFFNAGATKVRCRARRGTYIGELEWHVPLELMTDGLARGRDVNLFR